MFVPGQVASKRAEEMATHKTYTQMVTADNGKEFAIYVTIGQSLEASVIFPIPVAPGSVGAMRMPMS